jgi:hypothetical protein
LTNRKKVYIPSNTIPAQAACNRMQELYRESDPETQQVIDGWRVNLINECNYLGVIGADELIYRLLVYLWKDEGSHERKIIIPVSIEESGVVLR